ncbi:MAG TPA: Dabb family protein [Pseudonocardia sp.]|nr:Dabb family protein [Pseudonocardia sp.]
MSSDRPGFRHVVLFRWTPDSTAEQRDAAITALRELGREVSDLGRLTVGGDAGVVEGNFDAAVVVDFASREDYLLYATHPTHQRVIAESLRPILAERAAVQHEL